MVAQVISAESGKFFEFTELVDEYSVGPFQQLVGIVVHIINDVVERPVKGDSG